MSSSVYPMVCFKAYSELREVSGKLPGVGDTPVSLLVGSAAAAQWLPGPGGSSSTSLSPGSPCGPGRGVGAAHWLHSALPLGHRPRPVPPISAPPGPPTKPDGGPRTAWVWAASGDPLGGTRQMGVAGHRGEWASSCSQAAAPPEPLYPPGSADPGLPAITEGHRQ